MTVNTDNMTVSATKLLQEFKALQKHFNLSADTLKQLACNSAEAAFLSPEEKASLKKRIEEDFLCWYQ